MNEGWNRHTNENKYKGADEDNWIKYVIHSSLHNVYLKLNHLTVVVFSSKALTMAGTSRGLQLLQASCPYWLSPNV